MTPHYDFPEPWLEHCVILFKIPFGGADFCCGLRRNWRCQLIKSAGHQSLGNCAQNLRQERNSSWYSCPQPFITSAMGEEWRCEGKPRGTGKCDRPRGKESSNSPGFVLSSCFHVARKLISLCFSKALNKIPLLFPRRCAQYMGIQPGVGHQN